MPSNNGTGVTGFTVIATLSVWLSTHCSFVTIRSNMMFSYTRVSGAVNEEFAEVGSSRVTVGPDVWVHW